jgi:alanine racemase
MEEAKKNHFNSTLKVQIKVDTGMGRIGVRTLRELRSLVDSLKRDHRFYL